MLLKYPCRIHKCWCVLNVHVSLTCDYHGLDPFCGARLPCGCSVVPADAEMFRLTRFAELGCLGIVSKEACTWRTAIHQVSSHNSTTLNHLGPSHAVNTSSSHIRSHSIERVSQNRNRWSTSFETSSFELSIGHLLSLAILLAFYRPYAGSPSSYSSYYTDPCYRARPSNTVQRPNLAPITTSCHPSEPPSPDLSFAS